jgi:hypothetical protein
VRVHDGRRVHRAALAASPRSAADEDEEEEPEGPSERRRTAPRARRTRRHCYREIPHSLTDSPGPKEEGGGSAAARDDASTAAASGPLELGSGRHVPRGREKERDGSQPLKAPTPPIERPSARQRGDVRAGAAND